MTVIYNLAELIKQVQIAKTKMAEINNTIRDLENEKSHLSKKINTLELSMKNARNGEVVISEHALLRYIERELGLNIKMQQSKMLTPELVSKIKAKNGNGKIPHSNNIYILKDYVIVSVYPKSKSKKQ